MAYRPCPKSKPKQKKKKGTYGKRVPPYREREIVERDQELCIFCLEELGICTRCCADEKEAHHTIKRHKASPQHKHNLANLISLCDKHHKMAHGFIPDDIQECEKNIAKWCKDRMIKIYGMEVYKQIKKINKKMN